MREGHSTHQIDSKEMNTELKVVTFRCSNTKQQVYHTLSRIKGLQQETAVYLKVRGASVQSSRAANHLIKSPPSVAPHQLNLTMPISIITTRRSKILRSTPHRPETVKTTNHYPVAIKSK